MTPAVPTISWLGHASVRIDSAAGRRIYVDPWLSGNPRCPAGEREPERIDVIALTHGHSDHLGDTVALAQRHGASVVAIFELATWLSGKGVQQTAPMGKGGTQTVRGIRFTLTNAFHSSSVEDGGRTLYAGEPAGLVVELEDGYRIYVAGDTCVFGDMQLIGRLYEPDLAVLPIGDHFTMGPREAAVALELLGVKRCLPCHFGTFPLLAGTPQELARLAPGVEVLMPQPGEAVALSFSE